MLLLLNNSHNCLLRHSAGVVNKSAAAARQKLRQSVLHRGIHINQQRIFQRWQDIEQYNKEYLDYKRRMRSFIQLEDGMYITPESSDDVMPKKLPKDRSRWLQGTFSWEMLRSLHSLKYVDNSFDNIRRCQDYRALQARQYDQRFLPERLMILGADLAAAHFLVARGASVKFVDDLHWYKQERLLGGSSYALPGKKVEGLYLEAIDASGTELMYEGFDNLYDLEFLRMLNLRDCRWINDFVLSRIGGIFSNSLEMLDLSNCKKISAKGLLGLRSLTKLRFLRLEGLDKVEGIVKSALLLEEAIPDLVVIGLDYEHSLSTVMREEQLLKHDRVIQDAKGNAFVEDNAGRLFYVKGIVNERPMVDDADRPMMASLIHRELPKMEAEEFEELDNLSEGKLRHFLVGSPSGYSWTEQVETILTHADSWRSWERTPTDVKMLPRYKRTAVLEARRSRQLLDANEQLRKLGPGQILEENADLLEGARIEAGDEIGDGVAHSERGEQITDGTRRRIEAASRGEAAADVEDAGKNMQKEEKQAAGKTQGITGMGGNL